MSEDQYIAGIYNYCDRWCERCAFTARCRTFAMEQEFERAEEAGIDPDDIDWEAFWKRVGLSLDRTPPEWLEEFDEGPEFDLGITFTESDVSEFDRALDEDDESEHLPLVARAHDYAEAAHRWLRAHADGWSDEPETETDRVGAPNAELPVQDAVAIVAWYHTLLAAKLNRAVSGLLENERLDEPWSESDGAVDLTTDEPADDGFMAVIRQTNSYDANGSAKGALISIERSIGAWTALRMTHPELAKSIAPLQRLLGWLRVTTDRLIPNARTFHRPGFDDE